MTRPPGSHHLTEGRNGAIPPVAHEPISLRKAVHPLSNRFSRRAPSLRWLKAGRQMRWKRLSPLGNRWTIFLIQRPTSKTPHGEQCVEIYDAGTQVLKWSFSVEPYRHSKGGGWYIAARDSKIPQGLKDIIIATGAFAPKPGSKGGSKVQLHRIVAALCGHDLRPIKSERVQVHHRNHSGLENRYWNLEPLTESKHRQRHEEEGMRYLPWDEFAEIDPSNARSPQDSTLCLQLVADIEAAYDTFLVGCQDPPPWA